MTTGMILQATAFLVLLVALVLHARVVESKTRTGRRVLWLNLVALLLVGASLAMTSGVFIQERTGRDLGLSGGVGSDARAWIRKHSAAPPDKGDVGRNIGILADGVAFLRARSSQIPEEARRKLDELSRIPERPRRLLDTQEESRYYAGAHDVYVLIETLAKQDAE